jgi:hypothetical protein
LLLLNRDLKKPAPSPAAPNAVIGDGGSAIASPVWLRADLENLRRIGL